MKITSGLGSIDDYIDFVSAGADELFCGYIPDWWTAEYGIFSPLNRREVLYYNVQIGSRSEMEILHDMIQVYHVPVSITLNALYYRPEQYPLLLRYIKECLELGFDSFIIADFALLLYLRETGLNNLIRITVSGEFGEMNQQVLNLLNDFHIKRLIFHRKVTPAEMKVCTEKYDIEFEAFALNEKCHFHGGFCNSLHCDELAHICHLPYRLGPRFEKITISSASSLSYSEDRMNPLSDIQNAAERASYSLDADHTTHTAESDVYIPGRSGCGLCALWDLQDSGITHLKLVGRGNYSEEMIEDIRCLKKTLHILKNSSSRTDYISNMKSAIFTNGCSQNCYY